MDNETGNCWVEDFDTEKEAIDWLILNEVDYIKKYNNTYIIKIWETEEERDRGEAFEYSEKFNNKDIVIQEAKKILRRENYAYLEVIDSFNEVIFSSDELTEDYYSDTLKKRRFMKEEDYELQ